MELTPRDYDSIASFAEVSTLGMIIVFYPFTWYFPDFDPILYTMIIASVLIVALYMRFKSVRADLDREIRIRRQRVEADDMTHHHLRNRLRNIVDSEIGAETRIRRRLERIEGELGIEEPTQEKKGLNALFDDVDLEEESNDD